MIKPSIVQVIGQRVELRKAGKEYKALCPFHTERNPSFTVNEDKVFFIVLAAAPLATCSISSWK
jgi:DNA primase